MLFMNQASLGLDLNCRRTRKQQLLEHVVPWAALVEVIASCYPKGKNCRPPFDLEIMLRAYFMQQWCGLSDLGMEKAFFDAPLYRQFAGLDPHGQVPDESTILRFTGWRSTSWPIKSWRRSTRSCKGEAGCSKKARR